MTRDDQEPKRSLDTAATANQTETPPEQQTLSDVLNGQEPTPEFLDEFVALTEAPPLSEDELEKQALNHPGGDGDTSTPE